jgi:hypothetical protein
MTATNTSAPSHPYGLKNSQSPTQFAAILWQNNTEYGSAQAMRHTKDTCLFSSATTAV